MLKGGIMLYTPEEEIPPKALSRILYQFERD